jgi:hypothetical protein
MQDESATAVCRHEDCDRRFPLSRYGNRTYTSERTRRGRHLFCSGRCRKAHSRRLASLRGGVTLLGGTIPKGGVTSLEITKQNQRPLPHQKTTSDPHLQPREWIRVYLEDEAPAIGSGLRLIAVDRITSEWVHIRDHAGRTAKLTPAIYASLKPAMFGHSFAMAPVRLASESIQIRAGPARSDLWRDQL